MRRHESETIRRSLVRAFAAGAAGGGATAGIMLASDVGGIRTLLAGPGEGLVGAVMLFWGMVGLFGFLGLGAAIMGVGSWADTPENRSGQSGSADD